MGEGQRGGEPCIALKSVILLSIAVWSMPFRGGATPNAWPRLSVLGGTYDFFQTDAIYENAPQQVIGSAPLERQIRELGSDVHIFGHTHIPIDMTSEGVRYVQWPLGE